VQQVAFGPMQPNAIYAGAKPLRQSAFVIGILPILIGWFGSTALNIAGGMLEVYPIAMAGQLVQFACIIWYAASAMRAIEDLRRATNNPSFSRWPTLIPFIGIIYWITSVHAEMRRAKEMHGLHAPPRNQVFYFLFPVFAIQSDLNDLAR
jgi:hypothetical protein